MGSVCDRIEKYKPNESLYKMNDEDYKARDITINYTGLNSSFLLCTVPKTACKVFKHQRKNIFFISRHVLPQTSPTNHLRTFY